MDKQCFDGRADENPNFRLVRALKGHSRAIASCKFAPGSCNILATGSADKTARLWDPDTGLELRSFEGHGFGISDLSWSPKGNYLCTASDDHTLKLWDVETGKCLSTLTGHTNFVFCCSFSPHGNILVSKKCCFVNINTVSSSEHCALPDGSYGLLCLILLIVAYCNS